MTSAIVYSQIMFEKTYGGADYDNGSSVIQINDGSYIILGSTESYGAGDYDIYLLKTNPYGDTLWTRTFGGVGKEYGYDVIQNIDGGFTILGMINYDVGIIKTDVNGLPIWTKTIGGPMTESGNNFSQTYDGGYIIVGNTASYGAGDFDMYVIRTNSTGDTLWTKTFGGAYEDFGCSITQTNDSGFVIVGIKVFYPAGPGNIALLKMDKNGNILWTRYYSGSGTYWASSVSKTNDGGYIISGHTSGLYLIKTNANGDSIWTKTYGKGIGGDGISVIQTSDNGYLAAGRCSNLNTGDDDAFIIKTDANGDSLWANTFGNGFRTTFTSLALTNDGGYIFTGYQEVSHEGPYDVYLVKTDANGIVGLKEESININNVNIYPNPATNKITIYIPQQFGQTKILEVYDCIGQLQLLQTDRFTEIDISNLTNGLYFLVLTNTDNERQTMKIIKN